MKGHISLQLINGEDKNDKPIKDLILLINGVVFSRSVQLTKLPGDIDIGQRAKHRRNIKLLTSCGPEHDYQHRRNINLLSSCEHRQNMTIINIMNIKVKSRKCHGDNSTYTLGCTQEV